MLKTNTDNTNIINYYKYSNITTDIYDINKVKLTIDSFITYYFMSCGYGRYNLYDNINILIGVVSTICAICISVLSMYHEWDVLKYYIQIMVIVYYIINGIYYVIEYKDNIMTYIGNNTNITYRCNINNNGIYNIIYNGKTYKIYVYDIIYDNGILDKEGLYKEIHNIFNIKSSIIYNSNITNNTNKDNTNITNKSNNSKKDNTNKDIDWE